MFGFLRGNRDDRIYRQVYAECCSFQRSRLGVDSLAFLSYEAIFLYVLAIDAGACQGPPGSAVTCCRLRSRTGNWPEFDRELAEFCSHFAMVLAHVKLDDDVRDDRSLLAKLTRFWFRRRFAAAGQYFTDLDPCFSGKVDEYVARHLSLEQDKCSPCDLAEYVKPTAEAFGYFFGMFEQRLHPRHPNRVLFTEIGSSLGAALVAYDCAVDLPRDKRLGRYTPLHNDRDARQALDFAQRQLSIIGWECLRAFGSSSIAARLARFNFDRIALRQSATSRLHVNRESTWGRLRATRRQLRRGFCDCDCDPGCCDGGDVCDCGSGDCLICVDCGDCCIPIDQRSKKVPEAAEATRPSRMGMIGRTTGPLSPSGFVVLDGKPVPARTEGEWIDADTEVIVVAEQSFGVIVRSKDPSPAGAEG